MTARNDKFGDYLVQAGAISRDDVLKALQKQAEATPKIGTICVEEGFMTVKQVMDTLRVGAESTREFEDIALDESHLRPDQLSTVLTIQQRRRPFFGEVLIEMGAIARRALHDQLAAYWSGDRPAGADEALTPEKIKDQRNVQPIKIPDLYPEEIDELVDDIGNLLNEIEACIVDLDANHQPKESAERAAFLTNRVRGAAELETLSWLSDICYALEEGLLKAVDANGSWAAIVPVCFRGLDAIRGFVDTLKTAQPMANVAIADEIRKITGTLRTGSEVTQDKIDRELSKITEAGAEDIEVDLTGRRVLVIDDDKVVRNGLERYLRGKGMDVEQAENGAVGLEHLINSESDFDVLVVDLHMPIMGGLDFVAEVRKQDIYFDLPIIIFTASLHMSDVRRAISLGANGYLMKKTWAERLLPEIKRQIVRTS